MQLPSTSLQSLETCDLLIPDSPIASTRSWIRPVDTPSTETDLLITPRPPSLAEIRTA